MAKDHSFAAKVARSTSKGQRNCPVCGGPIQTIRLVTSEISPRNAYRFNQKMVNVCKCNSKEIYG
ncbi:MAG: hypothetical protein AMJ92_00350 [candidate division Zixibacteria bacterium SM23_81]|nr:MAG: hypothetical protein AMJ92_00350 [candidate division Zixibacteria bacterium SM23_81]